MLFRSIPAQSSLRISLVWQGLGILRCSCIKPPEVSANPKISIFLPHQNKWTCIFAHRFAYEAPLFHFIESSSQLLVVAGGVLPDKVGGKVCRRPNGFCVQSPWLRRNPFYVWKRLFRVPQLCVAVYLSRPVTPHMIPSLCPVIPEP